MPAPSTISHWCIAGKARRELVDFGYWYCRTDAMPRHKASLKMLEVKPQALDCCSAWQRDIRLMLAATIWKDFEPDRVVFQRRVHAQVMDYLANGIPERPARFIKALQNYYHTPELTAEQFLWPEALN